MEFELTPGVRLDPREPPAFIAGEEPRPIFGVDERLALFVPFMPPRIELFAGEPPPERPKYGWLERAFEPIVPVRDPELKEFMERPPFELFEKERFGADEK
jgi:hypothetical protein